MAVPKDLPLFFLELLVGGIMIARGAGAVGGALAGGGSSAQGATVDTGPAQTIGGFPKSVNPLPGAQGSRLDQGIDFTGKTALSPWDGKVVYSNASDSGWKGGGYVAIQSTEQPSHVWYLAEGWTPIVKLGQMVKAGEQIATPRSNPYNGIVGNGEAGLANPASPGQPLAQVVGNASQMVLGLASWLKQLGGPVPTSTGDAGHA